METSVNKLQEPAPKNRKTGRGARPDERWLLLSEEAANKPGGALLIKLFARANRLGMTRTALADTLGFTYSHLYNLTIGKGDIRGLGENYIQAAARFLDETPLNIKLAAGIVTYADLYQDPEAYRRSIAPAIDFIMNDPEVSGFVSPKVLGLDHDVKELIVYLYERATGKRLTPPRPDVFGSAEAMMPDVLSEQVAFLNNVDRIRHELEEAFDGQDGISSLTDRIHDLKNKGSDLLLATKPKSEE